MYVYIYIYIERERERCIYTRLRWPGDHARGHHGADRRHPGQLPGAL